MNLFQKFVVGAILIGSTILGVASSTTPAQAQSLENETKVFVQKNNPAKINSNLVCSAVNNNVTVKQWVCNEKDSQAGQVNIQIRAQPTFVEGKTCEDVGVLGSQFDQYECHNKAPGSQIYRVTISPGGNRSILKAGLYNPPVKKSTRVTRTRWKPRYYSSTIRGRVVYNNSRRQTRKIYIRGNGTGNYRYRSKTHNYGYNRS